MWAGYSVSGSISPYMAVCSMIIDRDSPLHFKCRYLEDIAGRRFRQGIRSLALGADVGAGNWESRSRKWITKRRCWTRAPETTLIRYAM